MSRTNGTNSSFSDLISEQIKGGDERRTLATRGGGREGGGQLVTAGQAAGMACGC